MPNQTEHLRLLMLLTVARRLLAESESTVPSGLLVVQAPLAAQLREAVSFVCSLYETDIPSVGLPEDMPTPPESLLHTELPSEVRRGPATLSVSPLLAQQIDVMNNLANVSDEALSLLHVGERDVYSRLSGDVVAALVDREERQMIDSELLEGKLRSAAYRWVLRGLNVHIAIQKVRLVRT